MLISSGNTGANTVPAYVDQFHFVHQPLTGDGTVIARVTSQDDSHPWAMAGVMIKASTAAGAPYAAMMLTPGTVRGCRPTSSTDLAGSASTAPRWLRLTRIGTTVTGSESVDGIDMDHGRHRGTCQGLPDDRRRSACSSPRRRQPRVVSTRTHTMSRRLPACHLRTRWPFDSVTAPHSRESAPGQRRVARHTRDIEDMAVMAGAPPGTTAPAPVPSNV